ncbi:MAG: metallophosphoesterase family protein [Luteolibacter sp.]
MKLLLVADLHYTLRQWDWLVGAAASFDLVVIAGDLLDMASIVPLEAQAVVTQTYLERLAPLAPLIVSSGNHDLLTDRKTGTRDAEWLQASRSDFVHVDGDLIQLEDCVFSILPWWESDSQQADVEAQLTRDSLKAKGKRWIWIHHAPPSNSPVSWNGLRDKGEPLLATWIATYNPEIVLSGHVHQAPFYEEGSWIDKVENSWVINSGHQIGRAPTATVIDTQLKTARWVSSEETEEMSLT